MKDGEKLLYELGAIAKKEIVDPDNECMICIVSKRNEETNLGGTGVLLRGDLFFIMASIDKALHRDEDFASAVLAVVIDYVVEQEIDLSYISEIMSHKIKSVNDEQK